MNRALVSIVWFGLLLPRVPVLAVGMPTSKPGESPVVDVRLSVPGGLKLTSTEPRMSLDVSPETGLAFVGIAAAPGMSNPYASSGMEVAEMVADLKTGKLSPIADLMGKGWPLRVMAGDLSPDRKHMLVMSDGEKGRAIYAIELPGGKPVKVAEGLVAGTWVGNRVAVSGIDINMATGLGRASSIRMVDPATGKSEELPIRGMVAAELPDGTFLSVADPNTAEAWRSPFSDGKESKARLYHVGTDGKILGDVASAGIIHGMLVVSANGKFIAFQSKPADDSGGWGTKHGFTIISVDGKNKLKLTTPYLPIAVMDDGAAVVISGRPDENRMAAVSWVSKDGKAVTKLVDAVSATVIGESLIYATNKDAPAIKTMPLPKQQNR